MRKNKRLISIILLTVLSLLSLKVIFTHGKHGSCDEFAHLHVQKLRVVSADLISLSDKHDVDDDCHEGKSLFAHAVCLFSEKDFQIQILGVDYKFEYSEENNFKSPYLKRHRKPPKPV